MAAIAQNKYQQIFRVGAFRSFWLGYTLSSLGDVISRIALTWFVFELTHSAEALGLLALAYTGPVLIGGLLAGWLLDRFDKRNMLIMDSLIRGVAIGAIPVLYALGGLQLWHIYLVAALYGGMMMIALAGSPALVPDLVADDQLVTANALETLSFTLSGVLGPMLAGLLLTRLPAPALLVIDALSYFLFAALLLQIRSASKPKNDLLADDAVTTYRLSDAVRLLLRQPILLATTIMFMLANVGMGALFVVLPVLADERGGGADLYGALLGALAIGEVLSSFAAGTLHLPFTVGARICLAQIVSGVALALLLIDQSIPMLFISLFLLGVFSAPLTIWAQTLRMQIIPPAMRGRTFALLRTLMQGTLPLGGLIAGFLLPALTMTGLIGVCVAAIGVPGAAGGGVAALRAADEIRHD
jgi:MFS family permease